MKSASDGFPSDPSRLASLLGKSIPRMPIDPKIKNAVEKLSHIVEQNPRLTDIVSKTSNIGGLFLDGSKFPEGAKPRLPITAAAASVKKSKCRFVPRTLD